MARGATGMIANVIRPPVKWHGGKHPLARKIIALFPPHHTYIEPFGGGASVLLNKPPSPVEVYNDLDHELLNLFSVLRDRGEDLTRRLILTPYSERGFAQAARSASGPVEQARRFIVRCRQSLGGRRSRFARSSLHRSRRGMADNVSAWLSAIDEQLPQIVERLRTVELSCRPAIEIIRKYDGPDTLFYGDPPYVHATREPNSRSVYACEMTDEDHRALAKVLHACRGRVVLSGYPSELYLELYGRWRCIVFDVPIHAPKGKRKARRRECLWFNFPAEEIAEFAC